MSTQERSQKHKILIKMLSGFRAPLKLIEACLRIVSMQKLILDSTFSCFFFIPFGPLCKIAAKNLAVLDFAFFCCC